MFAQFLQNPRSYNSPCSLIGASAWLAIDWFSGTGSRASGGWTN
jgi:hypothetical protein